MVELIASSLFAFSKSSVPELTHIQRPSTLTTDFNCQNSGMKTPLQPFLRKLCCDLFITKIFLVSWLDMGLREFFKYLNR